MQVRRLPRIIRRAGPLAPPALSPRALRRLQALTRWQRPGQWQRVAEIFGVSRATLYRGRQRYDPHDLRGLEARSRRPHRVRASPLPSVVLQRIQGLRECYPRWGREKLRVLLAREGIRVAAKTIDRGLARLRARGGLPEPPRRPISAWKRPRPRPYAIRKPQEYTATAPGDLVELDPLDLRPLPGVVRKHLTARDVVSRWDVLEVYSQATAATATRFLDALAGRVPFPLRALQVDGGSEFAAGFEEACQRRGRRLFVLPPRSPKLNGHVERAQRTHTEEFYECYEGDLDLNALRPALRAWEQTYNHVRPHQALGYLTPAEFLAHHDPRGPTSHMS